MLLRIAATGPCTQEDLEELNNNEIRDDVITDIAKHYNLHDPIVELFSALLQ